ncbi:MAG: Ig-like domain-containing protein [Pirellulaceae bacterium]
MCNQLPNAEDDSFTVDYADPIVLDVLANDDDPDGDSLTIISVSSTTEGGTVYTDGTVIYYTVPVEPTEVVDHGGTIQLLPDGPEDSGGVETVTGDTGLELWYDSFEYRVADPCGATDDAFVNLQVVTPPVWEHSLLPAWDTAGEIGIDGSFGYNLKISQKFAYNAPVRRLPGNQTWQQNDYSAKQGVVDAAGTFRLEAGSPVLADTNNVTQASRRLRMTDELGVSGKPGETNVFVIETVGKTLGFNAPGKRLPTPAAQPWVPNAVQRTTLAGMAGPTLSNHTTYVFVDRIAIDALVAAGTITPAQLATIKTNLQNDAGINYDAIVDQYESYSFALGSWEHGFYD